jgi:D-alanyl-D-alanine carboxypeptidase
MAKKKSNGILIFLLILLIFLVSGMFVFLVRTADAPASAPAQSEPSQAEAEPVYDFDRNDPNLVLVNKEEVVDEDYAPEELVYIDETMRAADRAPQYQRMQPEAAEAFGVLVSGAAADGMTIKVTTAYRPYSYQADLYYYYLAVKGEEWTEQYSAPPGTSEHQTGLAADVSCESINYELDVSFGETAEGKWLAEHAHEYGYILRYQEGREDVTGYSYEPWHIRYVGKDAAKVITEKGITLEEFLSEI